MYAEGCRISSRPAQLWLRPCKTAHGRKSPAASLSASFTRRHASDPSSAALCGSFAAEHGRRPQWRPQTGDNISIGCLCLDCNHQSLAHSTSSSSGAAAGPATCGPADQDLRGVQAVRLPAVAVGHCADRFRARPVAGLQLSGPAGGHCGLSAWIPSHAGAATILTAQDSRSCHRRCCTVLVTVWLLACFGPSIVSDGLSPPTMALCDLKAASKDAAAAPYSSPVSPWHTIVDASACHPILALCTSLSAHTAAAAAAAAITAAICSPRPHPGRAHR